MNSGRKSDTRAHFLFDPVPDESRRFGAGGPVDGDDAGRRGGGGLGQPFAADDVDADEEQPALLELRPERAANLFLGFGELGFRRRAADREVRSDLALAGDAVDRAGNFAVDQHDPLVALGYLRDEGLDDVRPAIGG